MTAQDDDATILRSNLRRMMAAKHMSARLLSITAGMNESAVKQILAGRSKSPRMDTIKRLADALECEAADLTEYREDSPFSPEIQAELRRGEAKLIRAQEAIEEMTRQGRFVSNGEEAPPKAHQAQKFDGPAMNVHFAPDADIDSAHPAVLGPRDLPIYASAQGGPDGMTVCFDPIEWVKRPEPLIGVPKGFGMYVVNDSMEPKFKQGDIILVHPIKPPRHKDYVLVVCVSSDNTHSAMVKQFLRNDDGKMVVYQFNPPKELIIDKENLAGVYLIVGSYEAR